jgi:hypothetical protein
VPPTLAHRQREKVFDTAPFPTTQQRLIETNCLQK